MNRFGLAESTVRELAGAVRGRGGATGEGELTSDSGVDESRAVNEAFARAAWSCIAEPGDGMAGLVVGTLGASEGLAAIIELWTPARLAEAVGGAARAGALPEGLEEGLIQALARWRPRLKSGDVIQAMKQAERVGARLLLPHDRDWPAEVDDLGSHAPLALWWRGDVAAVEALPHSIGLVGARAASGYGEHIAMEASAGLVDRGFAIVSGAAYGIDGMAHRAALASQGITIAFLAGGVDRFYPSGHDALLTRIVESGAVISELPCGAAPTKWRFLQRNRLIAASSAATVVLEAGWRSGSLNTAGHAAALGRPLGAVPGPVTSPTSAGCHRLIREYDAVCVTNAAEMAELVAGAGGAIHREARGSVSGDIAPGSADERTSEQLRVLDALSPRSPRAPTDVARRAGLSTSSVLGALGALGLEGVAREREDGWVRAAQ